MDKLSEYELIILTRQKDNDALVELCRRYQPMIRNVIRRYFLRLYDKHDWQQDALIICYESAIIYNEDLHVKFGGFFQLRFIHHAKSLLRYELARKRAPFATAMSIDSNLESEEYWRKCEEGDGFMVKEASLNINITELETYISGLSLAEVVAFRLNLGAITEDEALKILKCSPDQLRGASDRCRRKFKKI